MQRLNHSRLGLWALVGIGMGLQAESAAALDSAASDVILTGTLLEDLTVLATPSAVAFSLSSGSTASGSTAVAITTAWVLGPTRTNVSLYGYFSSATAALTDGGSPVNNIPSSSVQGQVTTGLPTSFTAFTQTGPFGASSASLKLFTETISVANLAKTRIDNLSLKVDLSSLPQLPAGVYTGTLHIRAQAL